MTVDGPRRRVRRDRSPRYSPPDAYGHHHDYHHHDHDSAKHEHENGQTYPPSPQPPYPIDTDPELPPDYHTKLNSHSVFSPDFHGGPEKREVSPGPKKRIIVCCDGTWMNSDRGYVKSGMFGGKDTLQVPSNVTRISRCFKRTCHDGTLQIVNYESGVGTGLFDSITGGAFGMGISERVSEAYTYICANYHSGDEIILVGFSRGAFTARSVAGMVSNLGLLTLKGLDYYYPIFRDMQHWGDDDYKDPFPDMPFSDKPTTEEPYRDKLEKMGLTRVRQHNGQLIKIKAICVWDTVGSLGIPRMAWMDTVGFRTPFYEEFKWHDTALSDRIEHAFQALALDETRPPFSPAVWERLDENRSTTDLRQVWFPGNHGNIGGGWDDQGISNLTLAWMMDQMASVGVEFSRPALDRIFIKSVDYYEKLGEHGVLTRPSMKHTTKQWAVNPIYEMNDPVRPWGLGAIRSTSNLIYRLSGSTDRTPGQYKATDMRTGLHTRKFLQDTNERVHSSVRIRLRLKGLNLNDEGLWTCPALSNWRLRRTNSCFDDPVPRFPHWAPNSEDQTPTPDPNSTSAGRWVWEYVGPESEAPTDWRARVLVEEPLGPYERYLLKLSGGHPNVYEYAMKLEQDLEMQRNNRKGRKKRYQGETDSRRHSHLR